MLMTAPSPGRRINAQPKPTQITYPKKESLGIRGLETLHHFAPSLSGLVDLLNQSGVHLLQLLHEFLNRRLALDSLDGIL